jgi:hypothetical protein
MEKIGNLPSFAAQEAETFRTVWVGNFENSCADACLKLKHSGIAFRVSQQKESRSVSMEMEWKLEIAVPSSLYEKAKEILNIQIEPDEKDLPDEKEILAVMELPDGDDSPIEVPHRAAPSGENWNPEEATVEIWARTESNEALDKSWIIELALKENRILFRRGLTPQTMRSFFVLPEDEARAREIVREVVEGVPPQ